jgi:DNA polymerase-4
MKDQDLLRAHLLKHAEYCILKMRRWNLATRELSIHVRDAEYRYFGGHRRLDRPATTVSDIMPSALSILGHLMMRGNRWNQVGLALHGLGSSDVRQQSLFEDQNQVLADERLQTAMDKLHERFGRNSVTRAAALPVKTGTEKELKFNIIG